MVFALSTVGNIKGGRVNPTPPLLVSEVSGVLGASLLPISQNPSHAPNLPKPYIGYISETNETTAAKRSRKQTEANGGRQKLGILISAMVSEFSCISGAFRITISEIPTPH